MIDLDKNCDKRHDMSMVSGFNRTAQESPIHHSDGDALVFLEFLEILERNLGVAEKTLNLKALGGQGRRF